MPHLARRGNPCWKIIPVPIRLEKEGQGGRTRRGIAIKARVMPAMHCEQQEPIVFCAKS